MAYPFPRLRMEPSPRELRAILQRRPATPRFRRPTFDEILRFQDIGVRRYALTEMAKYNYRNSPTGSYLKRNERINTRRFIQEWNQWYVEWTRHYRHDVDIQDIFAEARTYMSETPRQPFWPRRFIYDLA